jgi:hypothetical protein
MELINKTMEKEKNFIKRRTQEPYEKIWKK